MLGWLRRQFEARPDPVKTRLVETNQRLRAEMHLLRMRYDAAQTNDDNRRHWANADGLSAAAANSPSVRQILRNRSRYEYDNGSYCNGIVRTRADDLVCTGPTLQVLSDDDTLNDKIELSFAAWCRASCWAEKLHTMDQARNKDGEAFALLAGNPKINHPVKLDLRPIEADMVADPNPGMMSLTAGMFDGIEFDEAGNPISYMVLRQHPGDSFQSIPFEFKRYPAEFMLHWFRRDRPGQVRGVPELTPSLPIFPYLRRWTLATVAAAETAASFAAMLETEAPPDGTTDDPTPFETLEIERAMMTALPAGTKMNQLKAEHPTAEHASFKRELLNECGRPVRMPSNVVSGDSSQHNFSSAKLDHYGYRGALRVDRYFAEVNILDRIFAAWCAEAVLVGEIPRMATISGQEVPIANVLRKWNWPGWPSMDKDEAKNDTERLNNGTSTLAELLSEWGIDWKAAIKQRGRELKLMEQEGVPPPAQPGQMQPGAPGVPGKAAPAGNGSSDVPSEYGARRSPLLNGRH